MNENGNGTTKDLTLTEYGTRENVQALSLRIQSLLPSGNKLTPAQAMAVAQYAILSDANPFRGEVYGFPDRDGKLVLVDGYKLLVRWAKRQCNYSERFEPIPAADLADGDVGFTCYILREDARPLLQDLIGAGADWKEAFNIAATSAVGVIRKSETWSRKYKRAIAPPKGWTWAQVARKRALKNALNLSHGAPSPREIARESWIAEDQETIPSDWEDTANMPPRARARLAAMAARERQQEPDPRTSEKVLQENGAILHGEQEMLI